MHHLFFVLVNGLYFGSMSIVVVGKRKEFIAPAFFWQTKRALS